MLHILEIQNNFGLIFFYNEGNYPSEILTQDVRDSELLLTN